MKGTCGDGLGNELTPDPRTKRLRFFNVDNSNLDRARGFAVQVYQRKATQKGVRGCVCPDCVWLRMGRLRFMDMRRQVSD